MTSKKADARGNGTAGAAAGEAPPRRRQQDRSAATRARLLDAAIKSLYRRGYAATTTLAVAEDAGVSRGAMLHQFPTRVDLMLHVYRSVYEADARVYQKKLAKYDDRRERLAAFVEIAWERLRSPTGIAVLEMMIGARSDAELAARLAPLQAEIEQDSFARAHEWAGSDEGHPDLARLAVWTMRGLALARVLSRDKAEVERSFRLLERMLLQELEREESLSGRTPD
jgi:AcrR family transcriptional regulator